MAPRTDGAGPSRTDGARHRNDGVRPSRTDGARPPTDGARPHQADGARPPTDGARPHQADGGRADGAARPGPIDADGALLMVLCRDVDFPTPPWRLIVAAHEHGIAASSVARLQRLPERLYTDPADLADVLRSTPAPTPSMPPPPVPRQSRP